MIRIRGISIGIILIILLVTGCGGADIEIISSNLKSSFDEGQSFQDGKEQLENEKVMEGLVLGEIDRNPFLGEKEESEDREGKSVEKMEVLDNLKLTAVFFSPGKSYAVVNGRIIKERTFIDNKEVVSINKDYIVLQDSQGKKYLVRIGSLNGQLK